MSLPIINNQSEERFCNLMLHWYRTEMNKRQLEIDALEGKRFPYGTWVGYVKDVSGSIGAGRVIGYNSDDQCYKVVFEDRVLCVPDQPATTVTILNIYEQDLQEFHGFSVSLLVANYNPLSVSSLTLVHVMLKDIIDDYLSDHKFTGTVFPTNDRELNASNKAILGYRKMVNMIHQDESLLKIKKFHFGDIVVKKRINSVDKVFNIEEGQVGKIIGYDRKNNYYRVYFSKSNPYIGVEEDKLEAFNGTVPDEVLRYDPYDIDMFLLHLE